MLDTLSLKILKYIDAHPNLQLAELQQIFGESTDDVLNALTKGQLLINPVKGYMPTANGSARIRSNIFRISPQGRAYLQNRKLDAVKFWIPIAISNAIAIAALVVAIVK